MQGEPFPQVRAVGQADTLLRDQIILHLHDDRLLPLQRQLVGDLTSGQSAADDGYRLAYLRAIQIVAGLDHTLIARNIFREPRHRPCGDDDRIAAKLFRPGNFLVQMHLDLHLLHLPAVPCQQLAEFALVGLGAGCDESAAQLASLLVNHRLMPPQFQYSRSLHTADTAADDMYSPADRRRLNVMLLPLHGLSVDRASGKMQTVTQILIVRHTLVVTHVETAIVAEDAGTDILLPTLHHLGNPGLIRQKLTGKSGAVQLALRDGVGRHPRVQPSRAHHRNIHKVADVLHILEIAVLRHIDRRVRPVPGVVGPVVAV